MYTPEHVIGVVLGVIIGSSPLWGILLASLLAGLADRA